MRIVSENKSKQQEFIKDETLAINMLSEFLAIDNLIKSGISQKLPSDMELSHFVVLNYFYHLKGEKTPAQLAKIFRVTKGAMTNTINKLEKRGYIHCRPDWNDGRKKLISISESGNLARVDAIKNISPFFMGLVKNLGSEGLRKLIPLLREIRLHLSSMPISSSKQ